MNVINKNELLELANLYAKGVSWDSDTDSGDVITNARCEEPWHELLGNIPEFAQSKGPRRFAAVERDELLRRRDRPPERETPFLPEDVQRVMNSHSRMLMAEDDAVKLVEALKPWKSSDPDRIVWCFIEKPFLHVAYLGGPFDFARDTLWESLDNQGHDSLDQNHTRATMFDIERRDIPSLVKKTFQANEGWRYAVENGLAISGPEYAIQRSDWRPFAGFTNPFELLISLWKTGCFIYAIPNEQDSALRLYIRR